jgi:sugar phosphate isomerase/epimerase
VRVVALGTSFRLIGEAVPREGLAAYGAWADALGAGRLRLFDGGKAGDAAEVAKAAETLARCRAWRAGDGWAADIMIETHHAFAQPAPLAAFLAAAPDCPILWDTHHTWRRGGEDPVETWRWLGPRVVHVHVKDSVAGGYCLPGQGAFPMAALRSALAANGYSGPVSLEWERLWHPTLPPLADALDAARAANWWG